MAIEKSTVKVQLFNSATADKDCNDLLATLLKEQVISVSSHYDTSLSRVVYVLVYEYKELVG